VKNLLTRHSGRDRLARHRHTRPYAALVLQGGYLEAGDCGRFDVEAGQVILHGAFEAHQNVFTTRGAVVLNLDVHCDSGALARVDDPDLIVRLAERDTRAACEALAETLVIQTARDVDWPDQLCLRIIHDPDVDLGEWARQRGLAPPSISRGFVKAYGVTPKRFRADQRAIRAARAFAAGRARGARLAADLGFTDQAHMCKAIKALKAS
jgi:AraC-like DNA-binding protein